MKTSINAMWQPLLSFSEEASLPQAHAKHFIQVSGPWARFGHSHLSEEPHSAPWKHRGCQGDGWQQVCWG